MTFDRTHYRRALFVIHDIIIREWDPIGVHDEPMAQDEYDSYIPVLYRLLVEGTDDERIASHLQHIRADMGLSSQRDHDLAIARRLREAMSRI